MADTSTSTGGHKDIYYYIHQDLPSIKITEGYMSMDDIYTFYLSDITEIFGEIPPHTTFLGWYSPEFNEIFTTNMTSSFMPTTIKLWAKWDINTSFKFKGVTLFDFTKGGINITSGDLLEGTFAYNAQGFPIEGIVPDAAEVSF